ncbi:ANK-REP-REGION domain-containing protein [Mycena sanguinolenta]|uniref:ANK-REP-REGION domain-containing protein n=1 Tax=Mycena sanguinolenta TaxID=230812 RepID=A0A8H7DC66_9AGAR|nr:ANK-REP-REGION domain-containing protein [Mycena sanguinolenta]
MFKNTAKEREKLNVNLTTKLHFTCQWHSNNASSTASVLASIDDIHTASVDLLKGAHLEMSKSHFQDFPPELILLLPPLLTTASDINALALTCHRFHEILQPELEGLITPELGLELLLWAAESRSVIVAKLLSPPHSVDPAQSFWGRNALHIAVNAGNVEIVGLLLNAGANAASEDSHFGLPIHLAAHNNDLETMKLLLNHGAPIDAKLGSDETALHIACWMAHLEMVELLLDRGVDIELTGHYGSALGFAVARRNPAMVKLLLDKGADATVIVPLSIYRHDLPPT